MAGLDRKVLNSRRITKRVAPSNPVFSRSFITSFGVASYNKEQDAERCSIPLLFFQLKKPSVFGHLLEMLYICIAKPTKR